jgi:protein-S-isoprenylcysteine O-methyltransferase Ste14
MQSINKIFNHPRLRKLLLKSRFFLGMLVVALLFVYGRFEWYYMAFGVSFLGELIQIWASGSIEKNEILTVRGPYSLIRNPMYLGRFLVILGGVLLLHNVYVVLVFMVLFYFYMINRVKREENRLREIFGEPYLDYCRKVNRFVPAFRIYEKGDLLFFRFHILLQNNEHLNFLALLCFYAAFYVWSRIR